MKDRRTWWILLGLSVLLLRWSLSAEAIEQYYSRGFFFFVRRVVDSVTPLFPFPVVFAFFILLFVWLLFRLIRFWRKPASIRSRFFQFAYSLFAFAGGVVFFFMVLWGFNYGRLSIEQQLGLEKRNLQIEDIRQELEYHTAIISNLRKGISEVNDLGKIVPVTGELTPGHLVDTIRTALVKVLKEYDFPHSGEVQCRELHPEGSLLRFGTSGIYFPFTGEGHVDAALHPLQKPFVIAHELSHGYGFTDEGTCNFWAYLACIHSNNLFIRYVGHLNYWRYLASIYKFAEPEAYVTFRMDLPAEIQADLNTINDNLQQFPDILPGVRYFAYDAYLKSQGIEDGINNYDGVIPLVTAWWDKMKALDPSTVEKRGK